MSDLDPAAVRRLLRETCGDILDEPDPGLRHDQLRARQDLLDAVVSEIKVERAVALDELRAGGQTLPQIAEERNLGGYQRVQKILAQTADARAARST